MTVYPNGDEIKIVHVDNRHTDGDSIVYFTKNNVIHVGDDFNDKSYPSLIYQVVVVLCIQHRIFYLSRSTIM
jgi:glyoxylase-like metal-dependent hydrolase (beta-lactamase superfamily II)